ncbi:hypothetical protein RA265_27505 [Pseudomonas syringae pv. tagetis]|uniref:hypothetical protein n=1 Tax=Pseudomonas syringae group genomosp. 7 TaxID=251699 RepID=UPI00376F925B
MGLVVVVCWGCVGGFVWGLVCGGFGVWGGVLGFFGVGGGFGWCGCLGVELLEVFRVCVGCLCVVLVLLVWLFPRWAGVLSFVWVLLVVLLVFLCLFFVLFLLVLDVGLFLFLVGFFFGFVLFVVCFVLFVLVVFVFCVCLFLCLCWFGCCWVWCWFGVCCCCVVVCFVVFFGWSAFSGFWVGAGGFFPWGPTPLNHSNSKGYTASLLCP